MQEILNLILGELKKVNVRLDNLEERFIGMETELKEVKEVVNKLDKREQEHFELLFDEYGRVYTDLDKRLSVLE